MNEIEIQHVPGQFRADVDGQWCVADYTLRDGVMHMTHTGVPPALEGRGIASRLVGAAFEHAAEKGLKINPMCSYVAVYMERHPETASLRA